MLVRSLQNKRPGRSVTLAILVALGAVAATSCNAYGSRNPPSPSWMSGASLVFDDEFIASGLNLSKWNTCYPWAKPAVGCTNAANSEDQWYKPSQVVDGGGHLHLNALRAPTQGTNAAGQPATFPYRSGMVTTSGRFQFTYGYAEFMVKLPAGQALWPAAWLLPANHRWPPEIDVMEALGQDTTTVSQTLHSSAAPTQEQHIVNNPALASGWHAYGVDWAPGRLTWYIDGKPTFTTTRNVPKVPMYLLANLAVGGTRAGHPTSATPDAATLDLEWVRVWQRAPA